MGRKFGFSFSWKRALGISGAKAHISRRTGIPLTRSGRQRKIGRATGCFVATAVYGNKHFAEVQLFQRFRDEILLRNIVGCFLVAMYYYCVGPALAWIVVRLPILKKCIRFILDRFAEHLKGTR
jgi:hypothetical protein